MAESIKSKDFQDSEKQSFSREKKTEKTILERQYIIPLRQRWVNVQKHYRSNAAIKEIKDFISRHMKAEKEDIRIGRWLNIEIWKNGIKAPPGKISVKTSKNDNGIVKVELAELSKKAKKIEEEEIKEKEKVNQIKKEKEAKKKAEEEKTKAEASKKTESEEKIEKERDKMLLTDGIEHAKKETFDKSLAIKNTESRASSRSVGRAETHGA